MKWEGSGKIGIAIILDFNSDFSWLFKLNSDIWYIRIQRGKGTRIDKQE